MDGSKSKAVNNRDRNLMPHKLAKRMQQVEESIARYMDAPGTADGTQPADLQAKTTRLQDKLVKLRKQMQHLREIEIELAKQPDRWFSQTDREARSMATSGRGTGMVGDNVQVAADTQHHLIVATEVFNEGHDRDSLWSMAQRSPEAVGTGKIELIADRGYFKGPEILACEQAGVETCVPKPMTSNAKAVGRFSMADFIYIARDDGYPCPAGQRLPRHRSSVDDGMRIDTDCTSVCPQCPIKAQGMTGQERRVRRWEHEAVLDTMQARLDGKPDAMKIRRRTIEQVFATLKHWMGSAHFLMKTPMHVPTGINLHASAYALERVIGVLGTAKTREAMRLAGG